MTGELQHHDVVVTGLGATTPLGGDVASTWDGLLAGRSGVTPLDEDWAATCRSGWSRRMAVEPTETLQRVEARRLDRCQQFALVAGRRGLGGRRLRREHGPTRRPRRRPERLGVVIGSGIGGATDPARPGRHPARSRACGGSRRCTVPMLMPNGPAARVSLEFGARAGVHAPVSACATGAEAIALGLDLIRLGRADVVVAGGTEAASTRCRSPASRRCAPCPPATTSRQRRLAAVRQGPRRVRARRGRRASSCWSARSTPQARGARVYAELAGVGFTADAHHITAAGPERQRRRPGDDAGAGRRRPRPRRRRCTSTRTPPPPRPATSPRRSAIAQAIGDHAAGHRDQVDDRPPARRRRRGRVHRDRARDARRRRAGDHQPRRSRRRRRARRRRGETRRLPRRVARQQLVRLRRPQRGRRRSRRPDDRARQSRWLRRCCRLEMDDAGPARPGTFG